MIAPAHVDRGIVRDLLAGLGRLRLADEHQPGHHQRLRAGAALGEPPLHQHLVDALLFTHEEWR